MIRLADVRKAFNAGRPNEFVALSGITLHVEPGAITVVKGPSGSGKTTLLSLIGCMARPSSGRIWLNRLPGDLLSLDGDSGRLEVSGLPERFLTLVRRRLFGFIFQQFHLINGISVMENVMLPAYPSGERYRDLKTRAMELLESFDIARRAETRVEWLSGGEAQRVAIARSLINDPPVIIADEPTAHLDTTLSKEFIAMCDRLRARGKTVIVATHDPLICGSTLVDRVISMRDGRIDGGTP